MSTLIKLRSGPAADVAKTDWATPLKDTAGVFLVFLAVAYATLVLAHRFEPTAPFWPANAVVVAYLNLAAPRRWARILAAQAVADLACNLLMGDDALHTGLFAVANVGETALVSVLLLLGGGRLDLKRPKDLWRFIICACAAPWPSALLAASLVANGRGLHLETFFVWGCADALGLVVVGSALLSAVGLRAPPAPWRAAAGFLLLGVVLWLVFGVSRTPLLFMVPSTLLLLTFELPFAWVGVALLATAVSAMGFALSGAGPPLPMWRSPVQGLMIRQLFLAVATLTALPIASMRAHQRRLQRAERTAWARAEAAQVQAEEKAGYARLAEQVARIGYWRYDAVSGAVWWSDGVFTILDLDPARGAPPIEEAIGLYTPESQARLRSTFDAALREGRDYELELQAYLPDGTLRDMVAKGLCERDAEGAVRAVFGTLQDVTIAKAARSALEEAMRRAELGARAKAAFLANMSHEIRTPLNGVLGFAELLSASRLDPEQAGWAERIRRAGGLLLGLLNDILDFSRLESGRLELNLGPLDLDQLIGDCVELLRPTAEAKGVALTCSIHPHLRGCIEGDELRLNQVILNLLGNAVKFTHQGAVKVSATAVLDGDGELCGLRLVVEDTGIGIAKDKLELIFEEFSQSDAGIARTFGGSGLGLSISRRLVELMGGTLGIESEPGVGATLTVTAPTRRLAEPVPVSAPQAASEPVDERLYAAVLVVDDVDTNRELIQLILSSAGADVETSEDGASALARVGERSFDLVLMDMQMPGMDGPAAAAAMRAMGVETPIVALTANVLPDAVRTCLEAGMQDHLAKPVRPEALLAMVRKWTAPDPAPFPVDPAAAAEMGSIVRRYLERLADFEPAFSHMQGQPGGQGADVDDVAEKAHVLAGSSAMFGYPEVGEAAARLERVLRRPAARFETEIAPELAATLHEMRRAMRKAG